MTRRPVPVAIRSMAAIASLALAFAACGPGTSPGATSGNTLGATNSPDGSPATASLVLYSGRSESLVAPLIERFRTETGIDVQVKYGDTAELAATILEEGDASPADVYFAQDAGALGALAAEGRLAALPATALERVDSRFRSPDGVWVGVSGRARVAAYNPDRVDEAELPASIVDFTDPAWKGRIGWAPTNGSFQAFVTALRVLEGDAAARAWLEGIQANEPRVYEGNDPALAAVGAGEVHVAFINHYYLMRRLAEEPDFNARNHFFTAGDPGALVNVAGAGILTTADNVDAAQRFVEYLLTDESQAYFAEETFEYPLVAGVEADPGLVPLDEIQSPDIDLSDLADLEGTLALLREAGVL